MPSYVEGNPFNFNPSQGKVHVNNILKIGSYVSGKMSHLSYKDQSVNDV